MAHCEGEVLAPELGEEEMTQGDLDVLDQEESPVPTPVEEPDSGDEWDTDLEADGTQTHLCVEDCVC